MTNKYTKQKYLGRFAELIAIGEGMPVDFRQQIVGSNFLSGEKRFHPKAFLSYGSFVEWRTACITILDAVVPKSSIHRKEIEKFTSMRNEPSFRDWMVAFLKAISKDFEQGYFESLEAQIDAEVSSDYLHQAEQLLNHGKSGNKSYIPAAVLTGAVLEHGLRSIAIRLEPTEPIEVNGKKLMLNSLIDVLKKREVYNELVAKQLHAWTDVRNAAGHGNFGDFDEKQVKSMITGVSDFLALYQP